MYMYTVQYMYRLYHEVEVSTQFTYHGLQAQVLHDKCVILVAVELFMKQV